MVGDLTNAPVADELHDDVIMVWCVGDFLGSEINKSAGGGKNPRRVIGAFFEILEAEKKQNGGAESLDFFVISGWLSYGCAKRPKIQWSPRTAIDGERKT